VDARHFYHSAIIDVRRRRCATNRQTDSIISTVKTVCHGCHQSRVSGEDTDTSNMNMISRRRRSAVVNLGGARPHSRASAHVQHSLTIVGGGGSKEIALQARRDQGTYAVDKHNGPVNYVSPSGAPLTGSGLTEERCRRPATAAPPSPPLKYGNNADLWRSDCIRTTRSRNGRIRRLRRGSGVEYQLESCGDRKYSAPP